MEHKIVIVLPAYNEEPYIGTMVIKCKKYADDVWVIDDGSTDFTVEVATLAGARIISNGKRMGLGMSMQNMLKEATKVEGLYALVMIDADFQHSPEDIPAMIAPIDKGYDLVFGTRNTKDIPFYRHIGNRILTFFTNAIYGSKVTDTHCGFRVLSKHGVDVMVLTEDSMIVGVEMITEAIKKNLKMTEVSISVRYTKDGSTFNPIQMGSSLLTRIILMISKHRPLTFFGIGGCIATVLGLLVGIIGYNNFMVNQIIPIGTFLIAMLLIIVGILGIFTGVILNAMRKD